MTKNEMIASQNIQISKLLELNKQLLERIAAPTRFSITPAPMFMCRDCPNKPSIAIGATKA